MRVKMKCKVEWNSGSYETDFSVGAVSRKHALDKMIKVMMGWPCFKDREEAGLRVSAAAEIIEIVV